METYTYGGVAGRISARRTQVEGRTIDQSFAWSDLGPIATLGYPDDTVLADPARPVSHGYSLGYLTSVGSFLTSLSYHARSAPRRSISARSAVLRTMGHLTAVVLPYLFDRSETHCSPAAVATLVRLRGEGGRGVGPAGQPIACFAAATRKPERVIPCRLA